MVVIEKTATCLSISVYGAFELADYREFESAATEAAQVGATDLLFDLSSMAGATIDVALEDFQFIRHHPHDFRRIAVITNSQWVTWSAWLSQAFVDAGIEVFETREEGLNWLERTCTIKP